MKSQTIFIDIHESLVISFHKNTIDKTFCLICDYPFRSIGSDREFVALEFHGVANFARNIANAAIFRKEHYSYSTIDDPGAIAILAVQDDTMPDGSHRVSFHFDGGLGNLAFDYRTLRVETRGAKVNEKGGQYEYRDLKTGQIFDFHNPFPKLGHPSQKGTH